ncbi:hypothetical protein G7Y89_g10768 [Cudoniella acicularis]|uniref:Cytochrome b-c1 complex subunit 8 n=1 Tax=Cudoniella acicularis TaxID=354080 RepID=A0A8H4VYW7_9HELO|nr:hypothetical protein G7Y89_g10768 [Cudoniella acicularis]
MNYDPNPNTPRGIDPVLCWGHNRMPKQKGIAIYTLSANSQRPFAGAMHNAVFNTARRVRGQFFYVVPPFVAGYLLLSWMEEKNKFLNSKEGRRQKELEEQGRIRHVKCDEEKPACNQCLRSGRKCDGYKPLQQRQAKNPFLENATPPKSSIALPILPNFDEPRQKEMFAYFVFRISGESSLYFGANFWASRVLQLSLSDAAIRYALCSLSALQQSSTESHIENTGIKPTDLRWYALRQYDHAVRCTQTLLAESSDGSEDKLIKGLVACALFVCYENFQGNYSLSHMHLQHGLQIIARECRKRRRFAIPNDIVQVFRRLELQAFSIRDSSSSFPNRKDHESTNLYLPPIMSFNSIEDPIDVVLGIFRWIALNKARSEPCPIPLEHLESATRALEEWNLEAENNLAVASKGTKEQMRRPIDLLKMYQLIMRIFIDTGLQGLETRHDDHLHHYEEILALGEGLLSTYPGTNPASSNYQFFCFDIGIMAPLFWTAFKCRESRVRRRAVELLRSVKHREGPWIGINAAIIAEFVIDIEEEGLSNEVHPNQVTESARVHVVTTTADVARGEMILTCLLRPKIGDSSWLVREGRVPFVS